MDMDTFVFLYGGMMDVTNPELTEPAEERVARVLRDKIKRKR